MVIGYALAGREWLLAGKLVICRAQPVLVCTLAMAAATERFVWIRTGLHFLAAPQTTSDLGFRSQFH